MKTEIHLGAIVVLEVVAVVVEAVDEIDLTERDTHLESKICPHAASKFPINVISTIKG